MGIRFKIFRWESNFDFSKGAKITLVCMEVQNIAIGYLNQSNMMAIGNGIGRWIAIE